MTARTITAAAIPTATRRPAEPSLRDTLMSEWVKLTTLRSTYIMLGLGLALSIATTALASVAMGSIRDEWPADFDPMIFSMVGNIFALIIFSVFGVLALTREYSSGMMRLTLAASPQRWRVLTAKLMLVAGITLVLGIATTVGMSLVARVILGAYGLPVAGIGDADEMRLVLGLGAVMPFFPVVGLALGVLLRSTAGAITTVLGLLWLPVILGEMVPLWWQQNVISYLPGSALDSFTIAHVVDSPTHLDPVVGAAVAAIWLAGILAAAWFAFTRRDA